ncbi:YkgJ family cysteine cluster protein [Paraburkholderia sp. MMS20-SJTN17]|uniref:YkgJ family cysteine cluster protein n=1 Tax=Paraburkholderia translucens TaxID=2886945 RepID=A0ABS8KD17_9BURK|nr:YkgJ family cysteine cluster protein [Paraburkholderia sp. MMS20-SJTN17]MCC8402654.1 YkgJ family cysteine cluster protein [Paraburkholderia sp. MMS20-SJTN17]
MSHVCQSCGACCAQFRVSFYWGETDSTTPGGVPESLTTPISPHRVAMRGTEAKPVRCIALVGETGKSVACSIYERRSSTCREFEAGSERCIEARKALGFGPLPPAFQASSSSPTTPNSAVVFT